MDLFDLSENTKKLAPLAERIRPETLDDFIGQEHIVGKNSLLRRAIEADRLGSCIFYGSPGSGKTTLAHIIASQTNAKFVKLNAVCSGVADAKKVIEDAKEDLRVFGRRTYLLLDECHRWSKAQSDSVLQAIEKGEIVFIGSTTENPFASMTRAIVSRCRVFEFKPLSEKDILIGLNKALRDKKNGLGNLNINASEKALSHFAFASNGDLRSALNALELAAITTRPNSDGVIFIDETVAEQSIQKKSLSFDEGMYYDMLSAFIKSMRGSDSNAALYWAMRLIEAGLDPLLIARRAVIHASEDVGLADPNALTVAVSALTAFQNIGLPEGKIPLAQAIIYVSEAPKSNSVVVALDGVENAINSIHLETVPPYLCDPSFKVGEDRPKGYKYPHDFGGYVKQQYLPDEIKDSVFYIPTENGFEKEIKFRQSKRK